MSRAAIEAGRIYDSFPEGKRDMPRQKFIKEVCRLTDPKSMSRDLDRIVEQKRNKRAIDDAIGGR